jgi:hypothetical protein
MQKKKNKYNTCIFINFLISSYLTNNWLLGERVFRSWFASKLIIGIAKLGQVDKDTVKKNPR